MPAKKYKVLGIMSGTSMDGVDLAFCHFAKTDEIWQGEIIAAETIPYPSMWKEKLWKSYEMPGYLLVKTDMEYGYYLGKIAKEFLRRHRLKPDFISSHGHTIFHNPSEGVTYQLGNGAAIAASANITTVSNFRTLDVALKGQGAPLVPIGDAILFANYDYCLNLGGFANVSFFWYKRRVAFDICPVNFVINKLANNLGYEYDHDGQLARQGKVIVPLLKTLNKIPYYQQSYPKSLGREWVEQSFLPHLESDHIDPLDVLRTVYEHIAIQITRVFSGKPTKKVLVTGGGAHNKFLVELIMSHTNLKIEIPDPTIVDFKEAMIFAFLGVLRMREEYNCLSSVTGAKHDNVGGIIYKI
jgi:anhydro-N-acetylmuramic acid kinase